MAGTVPSPLSLPSLALSISATLLVVALRPANATVAVEKRVA
jgi:hypothetical protein